MTPQNMFPCGPRRYGLPIETTEICSAHVMQSGLVLTVDLTRLGQVAFVKGVLITISCCQLTSSHGSLPPGSGKIRARSAYRMS